MKKLFVVLAVAAVTLVACKKEEVKYTESLGEISFKAVNGIATKAVANPELTTTEFKDTYLMKVAATTAEKKDYFEVGTGEGLTFDKGSDDKWHATPAVYWPAGQKRIDFLAYGLPDETKTAAAQLGVAPKFDATAPANMLTVENWDVYTNQADLLYAAANNKFKDDVVSAVAMEFQHATALLVFNFGVSAGPDITITKIEFDQLATKGSFRVDNSKTTLSTRWYGFTNTADCLFPAGEDASAVAYLNSGVTACTKYGTKAVSGEAAKQLGRSMLVIPQDRQRFEISYKIADKDDVYVFDCDLAKGEWEAGKIYIYDIDFNLREITIAPTVKDWTVAAGFPETL